MAYLALCSRYNVSGEIRITIAVTTDCIEFVNIGFFLCLRIYIGIVAPKEHEVFTDEATLMCHLKHAVDSCTVGVASKPHYGSAVYHLEKVEKLGAFGHLFIHCSYGFTSTLLCNGVRI